MRFGSRGTAFVPGDDGKLHSARASATRFARYSTESGNKAAAVRRTTADDMLRPSARDSGPRWPPQGAASAGGGHGPPPHRA